MTVASWNVRPLGDYGATSSSSEKSTALIAKEALLVDSGVDNCTGSGSPIQKASLRGKTMRRINKEKTTGCKDFEPSMVEGLARCVGCEKTTSASLSVRVCKKIGTWNVRSLYKSGKLTNVISEMKRMGVEIMGGGRNILG